VHGFKTGRYQRSRNVYGRSDDSPSPCSYNIPVNPPMMVTAPAYTFRPKTKLDKVGGYNHLWYQKSNRQDNFPSPASYNIVDTISCDNALYKHNPSITFGSNAHLKLTKLGVESEPAPNSYNLNSYRRGEVLKRDSYYQRKPMYRIQSMSRAWLPKDNTPGPGSYNETRMLSRDHLEHGFSFSRAPRVFSHHKTLNTF